MASTVMLSPARIDVTRCFTRDRAQFARRSGRSSSRHLQSGEHGPLAGLRNQASTSRSSVLDLADDPLEVGIDLLERPRRLVRVEVPSERDLITRSWSSTSRSRRRRRAASPRRRSTLQSPRASWDFGWPPQPNGTFSVSRRAASGSAHTSGHPRRTRRCRRPHRGRRWSAPASALRRGQAGAPVAEVLAELPVELLPVQVWLLAKRLEGLGQPGDLPKRPVLGHSADRLGGASEKRSWSGRSTVTVQ